MTIDIVTPTRKIVDGVLVSEARLPAEGGEIQVLPGHTELLTLLGTGVLAFHEGGRERKFAVSYGFAEVRREKIVVLAEVCEEAGEIDRNRALKAQQEAEKALTSVLTEEQFRKYQLKVQRALVRQQISH
jgi:F-type H+-transporting ATPase subunit epsilon